MSDDKNIDLEGVAEEGKEQSLTPNSATRARNRTVMLTPEVTGEVRAKLARETEEQNAVKVADHDFVPYHQIAASSSEENLASKKTSSPISETEALQSSIAGDRNNAQEKSHGSELGPVDLEASAAVLLNSEKKSKLLGFLVAFDVNPNGEYFELRVGRIIVSSERAGAGVQLVIRHPSVSPMHAVLKIVDGGEVQVLDQLSEKGTKIVRVASGSEELLCGDKTTIGNGDKVYFGDREFFVCLINQRRVGKDDRSKSN
ncbi:MAG TPA: FHA domain-containing protein [Oligoflexia bacterium]|nr:FHA domain-containing protein [Oligoflexia bacterium]